MYACTSMNGKTLQVNIPPCISRHTRITVDCADPYALGSSNSNECPTNCSRILAQDACQTASAAVRQTYQGRMTRPGYPRGCYFLLVGPPAAGVYLNMDATGAGHPNSKLLCSGAPCPSHPSWALYGWMLTRIV